MNDYALEGKIVTISKNGKGFTVILEGGISLALSGDVLVAAAQAVTGKKQKGGDIEKVLNTALNGKNLFLLIK